MPTAAILPQSMFRTVSARYSLIVLRIVEPTSIAADDGEIEITQIQTRSGPKPSKAIAMRFTNNKKQYVFVAADL